MSDNNVEDDTGAATAEKGSSSECSDISIEKLNAEEPEVAEIKSTEDDDKVEEDINVEESVAETEKVPEDADPPEEKAEEPKTEEEPEKEAETVSAPSTTSSTTIVSKEIVTIADSDDEDDEDDDFEDETLVERLIGLTEMFPPGLITGIKGLSTGSVGAVKWTYSKSRNLTWIVFSSAAILFLPAMLESERAAIEEQDKMRKQQMLLGPSSALASAQNAPLPPSPA